MTSSGASYFAYRRVENRRKGLPVKQTEVKNKEDYLLKIVAGSILRQIPKESWITVSGDHSRLDPDIQQVAGITPAGDREPMDRFRAVAIFLGIAPVPDLAHL